MSPYGKVPDSVSHVFHADESEVEGELGLTSLPPGTLGINTCVQSHCEGRVNNGCLDALQP